MVNFSLIIAMNILFLTPQRPFPTHQGTTIRNFNIIAELSKRHTITLLTFLEADQNPNHGELAPLCQNIQTIPVPHRSTATRLRQMLTTARPDMSWRLWSAEFDSQLQVLLQQNSFDVVHIEGIEMAPYLPTLKQFAPRAKIIYDDHNAEWLLQHRNFTTDIKNPRRWIAAAYSFVQTQRLKNYEAWICRTADGVFAVSHADKNALLQLDPALNIEVVPNGVNLQKYSQTESPPIPFDIVFTGKMDYRPNIDAMLWFAESVLPIIHARRPETTLAIVGQRPHARLDILRENSAITITGFVDEIIPYIAGGTVYIAPFRVGGGTRLKLLQAMAMKKAIVATTVGAEGFGITSGREMILVDDAETMANDILRLIDSPDERQRLGENARQFVADNFTWEALVPTFEKLY